MTGYTLDMVEIKGEQWKVEGKESSVEGRKWSKNRTIGIGAAIWLRRVKIHHRFSLKQIGSWLISEKRIA
jgi:hypothetical protein